MIENSEGSRTTPSIVAYQEDGEILVGASAKRQAITNPKNTLYAIKRLIGRKFEGGTARRTSPSCLTIVKADNSDASVEVRGKKIPAPQEVSAQVLRKMKKTAEDYLGEEVTEAVITVPAYFNDFAAPGDEGRGPHRRSGSQADHQRADRGRARVRHGQEGKTARSPCTTWAGAPSTSRSSRSRRSTASTSSKCFRPTATRFSAERTSTSASSTTSSTNSSTIRGIDLRRT